MTDQLSTGKRITAVVFVAISFFVTLPIVASAQTAFEKPSDIQKKVETVFAEAPVMVAVAKCESGFRQFYDSGNVFRGGSGRYIGVFQIDENLHKNPASAIGFDIYTVDGNLGYAKYLYEKQGANPWKNCSNKYYGTETASPSATTTAPVVQSAPAVTTAAQTSTFPITSDLRQGSTGSEVIELQKLLNRLGFTVATTGAGSAGNETDYFGERTRTAVQRFQCNQQITCSGKNYGIVDSTTRTALQRHANQ